MTTEEVQDRVRQVHDVGYTILEGCLPKDIVETVARAFAPIYDGHRDIIRTNPNRGPMRHYIALPFDVPFYQSAIHANRDVIAIVKAILGEDVRLTRYATDTPSRGSVYQEWHGDVDVLFPEEPDYVPPPAVITVNFPLVDVNVENGPLEVADGTHRLPFQATRDQIERGEISYKPLCMKVGDVLIRDPRCVHRGTPNNSDTPRQVAAFVYQRRWYRIQAHHRRFPSHLYDKLSQEEQKLLEGIVEPPV